MYLEDTLVGVFELTIGFSRGGWQLTYKIAIHRIGQVGLHDAESHDCLFPYQNQLLMLIVNLMLIN